MVVQLPADPGLAHVLARALGDAPGNVAFTPSGESLHAPLTYTRVMVEHFDVEGELRSVVPGPPVPEGGSSDRLHAEQEFVYHRPMRAGEILQAHSRPGHLWRREGTRGLMEFAEVLTDFLDADGAPVISTRRVGVRLLGSEE